MRSTLASLLAGSALLAACSGEQAVTSPEVSPAFNHASGHSTIVVTEDDVTRQPEGTPPTDNWVLYTRAGTPPTAGIFRTGPGNPPLGIGSFDMTLVLASEKVWLFNYDHIGTSLTSISAISYATYKNPGSSFPFPSINIQIDVNGGTLNTGDFRTLVFEPYFQPGFVDATGVWETRDAINGGAAVWWATGSNPLFPNPCPQGDPCTWSEILAAFPGATIVGGFGVNAGSGNAGLDGAVDALSIAYGSTNVTYDFEPYRVATTADQCKNGGWMTVKRADGSSFKNQGDCVSFTKNGK